MNYIIFFATNWGYVEGGINSFNYDMCMALGDACRGKNTKVICVTYNDPVSSLVNAAHANNVEIFALKSPPTPTSFLKSIGEIKIYLKGLNSPEKIFLIGHDVFTGDLVNSLATEIDNCSSVVIHHMDYEAYYAVKGDVPLTAVAEKLQSQLQVLEDAGHIIAVGPKLKSSAEGKVNTTVYSVTPGLQKIKEWQEISKLIAITFGRYDERTDRLKQMGLAAKAFVKFVESEPTLRGDDATLKIFGVEQDKDREALESVYKPETTGYVNIVPLPYLKDRQQLFNELSRSNLSLMLSIHEGFGLVGLESIAASVPLIISKNSGLYQFLSGEIPADDMGSYGIVPVNILGSSDGQVNDADLSTVIDAIKTIRTHHADYRAGIIKLRDVLLEKYSWSHSANEFIKILSTLTSDNSGAENTDFLAELPMRLAPAKDTLARLLALSGNVCAFPGCDHPIFDEDFELVAEIRHIEGPLPENPRFNKSMGNEDRRQINNLVCLCTRHSVKTNNVSNFPTDTLRQIKLDHEGKYTDPTQQVTIPQLSIDKVYDEEKRLASQPFENTRTHSVQYETQIIDHQQALTHLKVDEPSPADSPFKNQLETILSLKESMGPNAIITLLTQFRDANWDALSPLERFRTLANLGNTYIETGDEQDASDLFLEAYPFQPDMLKAKSLAALGYTIKNDHENARIMIEETLAIDPLNMDAYQALVHTLAAEGETTVSIIQNIPQEIRTNPEIAHAIGFTARGKGNLEDAVTWFQIALDHTTDSKVGALSNLASTLLEQVDLNSYALNGAVSLTEKNKIKLAIQYFDEALEYPESESSVETRANCLINRGLGKKFLGDHKGGYEDILAGNTLVNDFTTTRQLLRAALENNEISKMWESLDKLLAMDAAKEDKNEILYIEGSLYIDSGRKTEGIKLLESLLKAEPDQQLKEKIYERLIRHYAASGQHDQAESLISRLLSKWPDSLIIHLAQLNFLIATGQMDKASLLFKDVIGLINDDTSPNLISQLADLYTAVSEHTKAARLLERIVNLSVYSSITKDLIFAYLNAGEYERLIYTCQQLLKTFGPIDMVTELLSWAYEKIDDLPAAVAVLTDYLEKFPGDQVIMSRLALVYDRQNDNFRLTELLNNINYIDATLPMGMQYQLTNLFFTIGDIERFKQFAYTVRRNFFDEAAAHDHFIAISVNAGIPVEKEVVDLNSAVKVSLPGHEPVTYLLEESEPFYPSRSEVSIKSEMGSALLGKRVGEHFSIGDKQFEVIAIQDKFDYAASESLQLVSTTFLASTKTRRITAPTRSDGTFDLDAFFRTLSEGEELDQFIANSYRGGNLLLGSIASLRKTSPIKIWSNYTHRPDLGLVTTGHYQEIPVAREVIKNGHPLVMDIIAIATLASINLLDHILTLKNEIVITQSTLEVLNDLLKEDRKDSATGRLAVGISNGQYFRHQESPEQIQEHIRRLERLTDWIKEHCTVVPVTAALQLNANYKEELDKNIGKSFIDTILTAKQQDGILYAEEITLRAYAAVNCRISGCATFMILNILHENRRITREQFEDKTLHLIAMNYKYIPADAGILYLAARKSDLKEGGLFDKAIKGLSAPLLADTLNIKEAARFFYKLYNEDPGQALTKDNADYKKTLTFTVLNELSSHHITHKLQEVLFRETRRIFQFTPKELVEIDLVFEEYFRENG